MTLFWILTAGLIGLALLFVLPPLLKKSGQTEDVDQDELNLAVFRQQLEELDTDLAAGKLDQDQYEAARRDLERELLYDVEGASPSNIGDTGGGRWAAALLTVAVPAAAVSLYLYLGNEAIIPRLAATASGEMPAAHPGEGGKMPPLEVMVQRLAEKLEQNPDNQEGWLMLGRSYFAIDQPERALYALKQAYALGPENPEVLVAYAEAIAAVNNGKLAGRPAELVRAALKIDPENVNARWLAGLISFQDAQYERAAEEWETLRVALDPKSEEAAELGRYVAEARSRAGQGEAPQVSQASDSTDPGQTAALASNNQSTTSGQPTAASSTGGGIKVEISLAESLKPRVDAGDSVFIYAKATSGPPMPLAARRARVQDLPMTVTLDDSMSMIPAMKLSSFNEVTVGARISKSGQAMPQSGDLEGDVSPVEPGQDKNVRILIDRVRP